MRTTLGALLLLLVSGSVAAVERLVIDLGSLEAPGWRLAELHLELELQPQARTQLTVSSAMLTFGERRIEQLRLRCGSFELLSTEVNCRQGRLDISSDGLNARGTPASFRYRFDSGELTLTVAELPLAEGRVGLTLKHASGDWRVDGQLDATAIAGLHALLAWAGFELPELNYQGKVSGTLQARGDPGGLRKLDWKFTTQGAGYSNADGSQAAESLHVSSEGGAAVSNGDWRIQAKLVAQQGMLYADPLYLEFAAAQPLSLETQLYWRAARRELQVQSLKFSQPQVANGSASGLLQFAAVPLLRELELELTDAWLPGLYVTWLQPWLSATVLAQLETAGRLQGKLTLSDGKPRAATLQMHDVTFRDSGDLFGVAGLDTALHWDNSAERRVSTLAWRGANFHQLQLGAADVQLETGAQDLRLQKPMRVPLLDGQLQVQEFELGADAQGELRWLLDGMLTPVSMQAFSQALGWTPLSGKLSGMVPKVRYENGELTVGGALLVQAFDGDIVIRKLRIRQPLGLAPRLWADAEIKQLDLATLTRTFSFGRIEGRFEGQVRDLYMEAWQPVAFDARFGTPADDRSRHRISQKAVDNISNLGGAGVGGALSRSFLRFLEDFPYKRLGIRCRLQDGVCTMGGIAPAERGYYLVEGTLLPPRLDVVGYSEQVDWTSLVERLVAATRGAPPTTR